MKYSFLIEYLVLSANKSVLKNGTMRVKNKSSDIEAKVGLEKFLKKKYSGFDRLVVLSCKKENPDIFNIFSDIFGTNFNM